MLLLRHRHLVAAVSRLGVSMACLCAPLAAFAGSTPDTLAMRERLQAKLGTVSVPPAAANTNAAANANGAAVASPPTPSAAGALAALAAPARVVGAGTAHAARLKEVQRLAGQWGYDGEHGPAAWARLAPEFARCASGKRQSPIDITGGIKVDLDAVQFAYRSSGFRVIDTGRTVQVNVAAGNTIEVGGTHYELLQFHFHRPSEERIDGKPFDMVAHLVHRSAEGKLAVLAVLLNQGSAQPVVQAIWNNLPLEQGDEVAAKGEIDLAALLPDDKRYYTYMGSLTTPPCSEGVLWMVMKTPVEISSEQLRIFSRLYPMNARPTQQAGGRLIKESQ